MTTSPIPAPREQTAERRPVAAFDFDGTLTSKDTLRLFLRQIRKNHEIAASFIRHAPAVAMAVRGGADRDRAKQLVLGRLLRGLTSEEAEEAAQRTSSAILASSLRTDTVDRLGWHLTQGHRVIVVSASFEAYVRRVMAELGVDDVIATRWEVGPGGTLTGRFDGSNVRGQAKATLLTDYLGGGVSVVDFAYGNTRGDAAMLAMAVRPVWVRRGPLEP